MLHVGPAAEPASPSGRQATAETAEKLDALMELVFAHLSRRLPRHPAPCQLAAPCCFCGYAAGACCRCVLACWLPRSEIVLFNRAWHNTGVGVFVWCHKDEGFCNELCPPAWSLNCRLRCGCVNAQVRGGAAGGGVGDAAGRV